MKRRKSTPEDDRLVRDDAAPLVDRACAVANVGADRLEYLEEDVARLLDHEEDMLREEAIKVLVLWQKEAYFPTAFRMLSEDPSEGPRSSAAFALGFYLLTTGKLRDRILRALARAVSADPAPLVVHTAYLYLVENLDPERDTSTIPLDIVRERDVDWKLLQPYLPN